jgi:alpha-amylase
MPLVCFYFQVHHPFRLRRYTVFDIGEDHRYENADMNSEALLRAAQRCYLPANDLFLQLIRSHKKQFRISFSISGTCLDQFEMYTPEVIDSFRALAETGCVEFLGETFFHSLSFLYSPTEFETQVKLHAERIRKLFGRRPRVFRNTELIYNNDLAATVERLGYKAVLAEGADHVLGWRSPNFVYLPSSCNGIKLLLKNYSLSDDIAVRFSDASWSEYPLTAEKFAGWLRRAGATGEVINLFMPYEVFGERHREESGIFDFMRALPGYVLPDLAFATLSEAAQKLTPAAELDAPQFMSWDAERDLTAWIGNNMQGDALETLYRLEKRVAAKENADLISVWRKLQSSDHFHHMCTKWFSDGDARAPFNPYDSPYDAYINFMNVLGDFELTLQDAPEPSGIAPGGRGRKSAGGKTGSEKGKTPKAAGRANAGKSAGKASRVKKTGGT